MLSQKIGNGYCRFQTKTLDWKISPHQNNFEIPWYNQELQRRVLVSWSLMRMDDKAETQLVTIKIIVSYKKMSLLLKPLLLIIIPIQTYS